MTPTNLPASMIERERQKIEDNFKGLYEEVRGATRGLMADLVGHLVERLTPDPDGRKKTFQKTSVTNLSEFLDTFHLKNITDDAELAELTEQAKLLLSGVAPTDLRTSKPLHDEVLTGMQEVKAKLDELILKAPSRGISLED